MNNEEAKSILRAYRPGGPDAADPRFHEALEQARRDPELAGWFAAERALDAQVATKLKAAIQPPADLKAMLLAERRIIRPVPWWRQPAWLMDERAFSLPRRDRTRRRRPGPGSQQSDRCSACRCATANPCSCGK